MSSAKNTIGPEAAKQIVAIRNKWHTKDHPFFIDFSEGKFGLEPLGRMMAQHYAHTQVTSPILGIALFKASGTREGKRALLENMAEEEGLMAGPGEDREALNHDELILRFTRHTGISDAEVYATEQMASWRARSYYYCGVVQSEAFPVIAAMMSTQEGQQPGINHERTLPGLYKHHGFKPGDPIIEFFTEHELADADHSNRQIDLVAKLITTDEMAQRALHVCELAVKTRWACISEIYKREVLGEPEILPRAVVAA
jgi:pyrroloquinoline quinone (PQQ) biosynthesis protein C